MSFKRGRGTDGGCHLQPANKRVHRPQPLQQYRPTNQWRDACESVIHLLSDILKQCVGSNWTVIPQGSYVQGLQLAGSDLDLVLLDGSDKWRHLNRRRNADELESAIRKITRAQRKGFPIRISVIQKIYSARVPLARLRVTIQSPVQQQVQVDMCFGDPSRGLCDQFVGRSISRSLECESFVLALKIWATKRGLCETHTGGISCFAIVLLAIYHYKTVGPNFISFLSFLHSLRYKTRETVSLENLKIQLRPSIGMDDFIHVAVPCRPMDNAARCVQLGVWTKKIVPEINRAKHVIENIAGEKVREIDWVVFELLKTTCHPTIVERRDLVPEEVPANPYHRYINADSSLSSSDTSSEDEEDDEDDIVVEEVSRSILEKEEEKVIDLDNFATSSASSVDSERLTSTFSNTRSNEKVRGNLEGGAGSKSKGPIVIHECEECNYFAFSKGDLDTHYYAIHNYQKKNRGFERKNDNKFRIGRKFKKQVGYQVPNHEFSRNTKKFSKCEYKLEIEFIHRSSQCQLSPVGDVTWLSESVFAIGFQSGLVEIVDAEERRVVKSYVFDHPVHGLCGEYRHVNDINLFIQLKGDKVLCVHVSEDRWDEVWTIPCSTAITFSKPILLDNGNILAFIASGQTRIVFANTKNGTILHELDLALQPEAKGIVTGISRGSDSIFCLVESGKIVQIGLGDWVIKTNTVAFPVEPSIESIISSSIETRNDGTCLIGFSNGSVRLLNSTDDLFKGANGIGCMRTIPNSNLVILGTWKGELYFLDGVTNECLRSPHATNICQISVSPGNDRVAVASTDSRVSIWSL